MLKYCNELLNRQMDLMGIKDSYNIYFSYSQEDIKYVIELSSEGDEIYKNYLSNFESKSLQVREFYLKEQMFKTKFDIKFK